ncbi:unnamed protein product [Cylicocyclus nassatus]|uniref:ShKT domain-containing protein n=1 Tax=Cylicocyclus nassatus TaxID=53992 RepID=A0AA36H374_CYLNA|nr:unnamed protein product [Cylicocyclus nassatus]
MIKVLICLMSFVAIVLSSIVNDNVISPEFILGTPLTETTIPPPKNCTDNITICDKYLSLCANKLYQPVMSIQCAKTCKFCTACEDKSEKPPRSTDIVYSSSIRYSSIIIYPSSVR